MPKFGKSSGGFSMKKKAGAVKSMHSIGKPSVGANSSKGTGGKGPKAKRGYDLSIKGKMTK